MSIRTAEQVPEELNVNLKVRKKTSVFNCYALLKEQIRIECWIETFKDTPSIQDPTS